jgi:rhodanese-related sulfurtransferase
MMRQRMARLPKPLQMQAGMLAVLGFAVFVWSSLSQPDPQVPKVGVEEARQMVDAGAALVDVRAAEAFAARHLPGAVNVPLQELRVAVPPSFAQATARDRPVVVYGDDEGAALLMKAGYARAVIVEPEISSSH